MALMRFSWEQIVLAVVHSIVPSAGLLNSATNWVVLLELGKFGSHLDAKGLTVDRDLQLKNFECARHTLSEIWSGPVINGNHVVAEIIEDDASTIVEQIQNSNKHVAFGNCNFSDNLWNVQIQNVARAFNHHTWKLFVNNFYGYLISSWHTLRNLMG